MKYLLLIIVLATILFAGFYFYQNSQAPPPPPDQIQVEQPEPLPPPRLVWSWRYRVTAEERVSDREPNVTTMTGPWLSLGVVEGEPASSRLQLPDGSYLEITGHPQLLADGKTSFAHFSYKWQGMKRHHWLPSYSAHFADVQMDSVSGERSTWGYVMLATIPDPSMPGALPKPMPEVDSANEPEPTPEEPLKEMPPAAEPKNAPPKADSTRPEVGAPHTAAKRPAYDTTRPEVGAPIIKPSKPKADVKPAPEVDPKPAEETNAPAEGVAEEKQPAPAPAAKPDVDLTKMIATKTDVVDQFQSIGSWASTKADYQGVITLSLEMRLAPEKNKAP